MKSLSNLADIPMLKSSQILDRVATELEGLGNEIPQASRHLQRLAARVDRVSNTLEASEEAFQRVSQVEGELEKLGVDFTVEPTSAHKEATCIHAYRGQLDSREAPLVLGRIAQKYGSTFENPGNNQPYKILIPHTA